MSVIGTSISESHTCRCVRISIKFVYPSRREEPTEAAAGEGGER